MVRGGSKRDDGLPAISSTNIFSALESLRRKSNKKRLEKEKGEVKTSVSSAHAPATWATTPVSVTSWADCEEDDDDYFAMPALPLLPDQVHDNPHNATQEEQEEEYFSHGEESEGDEEVEEEADVEIEEQRITITTSTATQISMVVAPPMAAREPERQLSKKELKKKELAELDAVLAELGLNSKDERDNTVLTEIKEEESNGEANGQGESVQPLVESKSSKRRKAKKEKSFKEGKEEEGAQDSGGPSKSEELVVEDIDRSEMLRKFSSMKKRKSFKDGDLSAAKTAAAEAAVRAAKLAAAKKKEKNHYNQQPVR